MSFRQKTLKFSIRDHEWKIIILPPSRYLKQEGEGDAIMETDERWIKFRTDKINKRVIRHELFHVFCSYLYNTSADLSVNQYEEQVAEMLEHHLEEYYKLCTLVFNKIVKYKTEEKEVDNSN